MSVRVGMVSFAHVHAPNYAAALDALETAEFVGVADNDEKRGREAAERHGVGYFSGAGQLCESADAVVVCSENCWHARDVIPALRAGVDVLCEKPIATTLEDARKMIRVSEETGSRLGIAFPVRHIPAIQSAREILRSGAIGRVLAVNGTNHSSIPGGWFLDPETSGGGAVMDHAVHVADTLRFLLGGEVRSVYAEVGSFFGAESVDDAGILTVEIEGGGYIAGGVFATIDPSWSRGDGFPIWGDFTLRITGTEGVLDLDAFNRSITTFSHVSGDTTWTPAGEDPNVLMIEDYLRGGGNGADGHDGLRALEVVLAAYRSGRGNEPVVVEQA